MIELAKKRIAAALSPIGRDATVVKLTSITLLLSTILLAGPAGSRKPAPSQGDVIAVINVPQKLDSKGYEEDQVVVFHGIRLSGSLVFAYEDGRLLVNGAQWLPGASAKPTEKSNRFSAEDSMRYREVPAIRKALAEGQTLNHAVDSFRQRRDTLLENMVKRYREETAKHSLDPETRALALLDTTIGSAHDAQGRPSRVDERYAEVYFPGFGWYGYIFTDMRAPHPNQITREMAAYRTREVVSALAGKQRPVVVVIGNATIIAAGGDVARDALAEVNDALHGVAAKPGNNKRQQLPDDVREEIRRANAKQTSPR